jgi:hypothetical protein
VLTQSISAPPRSQQAAAAEHDVNRLMKQTVGGVVSRHFNSFPVEAVTLVDEMFFNLNFQPMTPSNVQVGT